MCFGLLACLAVWAGRAADAPRPYVMPDGSRVWIREGVVHRDDGPALVGEDGSEWWFQAGLLHRDGGPAVTFPDGAELWCRRGLLHRDGGPAVVSAGGRMGWWIDGVPYRQDVPVVDAVAGGRWGCDGRPWRSAEMPPAAAPPFSLALRRGAAAAGAQGRR